MFFKFLIAFLKKQKQQPQKYIISQENKVSKKLRKRKKEKCHRLKVSDFKTHYKATELKQSSMSIRIKK